MDSFESNLVMLIEAQLRNRAGGDRIYITKKGSLADKSNRDNVIRKKFTGNNIKQLSVDHDLSEKQIRRICRVAYVKK